MGGRAWGGGWSEAETEEHLASFLRNGHEDAGNIDPHGRRWEERGQDGAVWGAVGAADGKEFEDGMGFAWIWRWGGLGVRRKSGARLSMGGHRQEGEWEVV